MDNQQETKNKKKFYFYLVGSDLRVGSLTFFLYNIIYGKKKLETMGSSETTRDNTII
jgi:hypothetical protein